MNILGCAFLCLLASPQTGSESDPAKGFLESQIQALQSEPGLSGKSWELRQDPSYLPFVFVVEKEAGEEGKAAADAAKEFGPPLVALLKSWQSEWVEPLQLQPKAHPPRLTIALLSHFEAYKRFVGAKLPAGATVPPCFAGPQGLLLSYHRGPDFESKAARRQAILDGASERLIAWFAAEGEGKRGSGWLRLALAAYIGEIQSKRSGPKGTQYFRAEIPNWKQDLPRLADELTSRDIALPGFEEILSFASIREAEEKASALAKAARQPEDQTIRLYRDYVRTCGYSLLLFFRSKAGETHQKAFYSFVKEDLRGEGGGKRFREIFQAKLASIEASWEEFCEWKPAEKPAPLPKAPSTSKAPLAVPALPPPVPLDLSSRTLLDLRAELVSKMQSRRMGQALELLRSPQLAQNPALAPLLQAEEDLFRAPKSLYLMFGRRWKPGDSIPSGFGFKGEFAAVDETGFEIKGKAGPTIPWQDLDLRAVANYLYYSLKYNDAKTARDVGVSLLLSGEAPKARKFFDKAAEEPALREEVERLRALIPPFEAAAREALVREEIQKLASLQPSAAVETVRRLSADARARDSAAFRQAKPFLLGLMAEGLSQSFDAIGMQSLFRGKVQPHGNGAISISYDFQDAAQLQDWTPGNQTRISANLGLKASDLNAQWKWEKGFLLVQPTGALFHNSYWKGDLSLSYKVVSESPEAIPEAKHLQLIGGIKDDGKGNCAVIWAFSALVRYFPAKWEGADRPLGWKDGEEYSLRIDHSGGKLRLFSGEQEIDSRDENQLDEGRIFFFALGPLKYWVSGLSIKGTLDPRWIEQQKVGWVRKELEGIFGSL